MELLLLEGAFVILSIFRVSLSIHSFLKAVSCSASSVYICMGIAGAGAAGLNVFVWERNGSVCWCAAVHYRELREEWGKSQAWMSCVSAYSWLNLFSLSSIISMCVLESVDSYVLCNCVCITTWWGSDLTVYHTHTHSLFKCHLVS